MNRTLRFLFVAVAAAAPAAAQGEEEDLGLPPVAIPRLPAQADRIERFVPAGWRIETSARGDLNGDGRPDFAFVLRTAQPVTTTTEYGMSAGRPFDSSPRLLAAALFAPGEGYRLALQTDRLIPRPYTPVQEEWMFEEGSLTIERGALVVDLGFLGSSVGTIRYRLRWQEGAFRLIGYDYASTHRYTHCSNTISINYLTRRMRASHADDGDSPERTRWRPIAARPLLRADEIRNGMEFDPEGAVSVLDC